MKMLSKGDLVSVIIVNYNNAPYLDQSIQSVLKQSYKNIEIIVVDDKSKDDSIKKLRKYKNKIKVIKNKIKTRYGSYNQINSYYNGFLKSKGKYLFLLDSDDFFKLDKVKYLVNEFKKKNVDLIFDLPILKFKKKHVVEKFKQKKFIFSNWPRFSPQSCIALKRDFAQKVFKNLRVNKFDSIWFDFRIAIYYFLLNNKLYVIKKHLTYYRQLENSASKDYRFPSKKWWYRRNQAHDFISFFSKKLNVKNKITVDKILTKFFYIFFR